MQWTVKYSNKRIKFIAFDLNKLNVKSQFLTFVKLEELPIAELNALFTSEFEKSLFFGRVNVRVSTNFGSILEKRLHYI